MTKAEAEEAVISEWHRWIAENPVCNPTGRDALSFFAYLQRERPNLLNFRSPGDKWQVVHGWLLRRRLVSDGTGHPALRIAKPDKRVRE